MTESKHPAEQLLDLLLYTPLGFAMEARTLVPELAEKGRQQFDAKVSLARMIGQFAVAKGQVEVRQAVQRLRDQRSEREAAERAAASRRRTEAPIPRPTRAAVLPRGVEEPAADDGEVEIEVRVEVADIPVRTDGPSSGTAAMPAELAPPVGSLAIPDYDALAASQVVPRLPGLTAGELEAVRAYEAAGRGRKTILSRIAQLQAAKG